MPWLSARCEVADEEVLAMVGGGEGKRHLLKTLSLRCLGMTSRPASLRSQEKPASDGPEESEAEEGTADESEEARQVEGGPAGIRSKVRLSVQAESEEASEEEKEDTQKVRPARVLSDDSFSILFQFVKFHRMMGQEEALKAAQAALADAEAEMQVRRARTTWDDTMPGAVLAGFAPLDSHRHTASCV